MAGMDADGNLIHYEEWFKAVCCHFNIPLIIFTRQWRSWIAHETSNFGVLGSNPSWWAIYCLNLYFIGFELICKQGIILGSIPSGPTNFLCRLI